MTFTESAGTSLGHFPQTSSRARKRICRAWTATEKAVLAREAHRGIGALRKALPARTTASIRQKAIASGVEIAPTRQGGSTSRWRGKLPIPAHCHPLVRRFIEECNRQQAHLYEIGERSGLATDTISDWRYRRMPTLDNFDAALNVLGLRLAIVHDKAGEGA